MSAITAQQVALRQRAGRTRATSRPCLWRWTSTAADSEWIDRPGSRSISPSSRMKAATFDTIGRSGAELHCHP